MSTADTKALIEQVIAGFQHEVPALAKLKLVFELEQYPEDKTEKDLEQHVAPAVRKHMLDFLSAIDNRTKPVADIEQGHISSASCILANLSVDLGRSLAYDPVTRTIPGDEEATAALARKYRDPWKHPTPETV